MFAFGKPRTDMNPVCVPGPVIIVLAVLVLPGCPNPGGDAAVSEPIEAGLDSSDQDLAGHLQSLHGSAVANPGSGFVRGRLGMAYDINGFNEAAIKTYQQAESIEPADFRWPYFSSQLLAQQRDYEGALASLQRAIDLDADYPASRLWQGSWLLELGRLDEAMAAFELAEAQDAGPAALLGRARVMIARGDVQAATELLVPLARTWDHPYVHRTLGEALRGLGRVDEARVALAKSKDAKRLTWSDPLHEQRNAHVRGYASFQYAQELSAAGRIDESLEIIRRLQVHHPEAHCARADEFFLACNLMNSTGIALDRAGRAELAQETIERGLGFNETFIPFHITMTNLLRQQGKLEAALVHIDRALALNGSRAYAHEQRGRLLFGLGQFEQARAAFETSLQFEPGKQTTSFYLGLAHVELGRWTDATEQFERVVELAPEFAPGYVFLARSLGEQRRIAEARGAKEKARQYGASPAQIRDIEIRLRQLEARP